jgi:hypothetical protein
MKKNNLTLIGGGLAVVALVAFLFVPNLVLGVAPFLLLLLICPLMMMFMMGGMQHGGGGAHGNQAHSDHLSQPTSTPWPELTREEQIAELKTRLAYLEAQATTQTITGGSKSEGPVIREAEAIARAADTQNHDHRHH